MKSKLLIPIIFICTFLLTACFENDYREVQWKEEVKLENGKIITIESKLKGEVRKEFGGGYSDFNTFSHDIQVIDTAGLGSPPPIWSSRWIPRILDKGEDNLWYMVVTVGYCYDWNSEFPYRQYKVIDGRWQQVLFEMDKLEGKEHNLVWSIPLDGSMPSFLSYQEKAIKYPSYRKIEKNKTIGCSVYCLASGGCSQEDFCTIPNNRFLPQCLDYGKRLVEECKLSFNKNNASCKRLFQENQQIDYDKELLEQCKLPMNQYNYICKEFFRDNPNLKPN